MVSASGSRIRAALRARDFAGRYPGLPADCRAQRPALALFAAVSSANVNDSTVSVISGKTNTVTKTIPVGMFPHDMADNPLTNTAYVTNFGDNTGSVIRG